MIQVAAIIPQIMATSSVLCVVTHQLAPGFLGLLLEDHEPCRCRRVRR